MKHNYQITPSIYCANTADLKTNIEKLMAAGITWMHFTACAPKELADIKTIEITALIKEIKSYNLKVVIALDLEDDINDVKPF